MKRIMIGFAFVVVYQFSFCQLKLVDKESSITFKVKNFGFTVSGVITGIVGDIVFEPNNLANASFKISIDASTINTDNSLRDDHLKGEPYFDVNKFPRIEFISSSVSEKNGTFILSGTIKIKNHSKNVSFPFTATSSAGGYLFNGKVDVNRKDFDIGGTSTISNNVEVILHVVANTQQHLTSN